jgi:hypothetical protein
MWQELMVFGLFFGVLGYGIYKMLVPKKNKKNCGCDGCT